MSTLLDCELPEWTESPIATDSFSLWMRNTPSNHGEIINLKYLTTEPGKTFISPRRFSVVVGLPKGYFALQIVDIAYDTPYDSFDEPDEIFRKYLDGQVTILMGVLTSDPLVMSSVEDWSGMSQDLQAMFPRTKF